MPSLPKYQDCEYSLFISYAHADNKSNNQWVTCLRNAIWNRMSKLNRTLGGSPTIIHMSEENGPSAGHLSVELKKRVEKSFAMLLVVGEDYVNSDWCEKELQLFAETFGAEGFASRLYVVVMTQDDLHKAEKGHVWRQHLAPDQLWMRLFDEKAPNKPIKPGATEAGFDNEFLEPVEKIADHLIESIKNSWRQSLPSSATANSQQQPLSLLSIGFSPVTSPELEEKMAELHKNLEGLGLKCTVLAKELFTEFDPDHPPSIIKLQKALEPLDALIVPFQETTPLAPGVMPGGHLSILEQEWQNIGNRRQIIWYKPFSESAQEGAVAPRHLQKIRSLSPVYDSEQRVCGLFFSGVSSLGEGIRIRIQNHSDVKVFELLKDKIQDVWNKIIVDEQLPPHIEFRPLDLNNLDDRQKDSYGYVVVNPVPLKSSNALSAQITKVEKVVAKGNNFAGRIALVFRPGDDSSIPEIDWPIIKCKQVGDNYTVPDDIDLKPDGENEIEQFLKKLLKAYKKNKPASDLQRG